MNKATLPLGLERGFWHSKLQVLKYLGDSLIGRTEGFYGPLKIFVQGKQGLATCFLFC
jgi:hypothetical protein